MASPLSFYGHISSHFDKIFLKIAKICLTYENSVYFMKTSNYENSKNIFYDVITMVLYYSILLKNYEFFSNTIPIGLSEIKYT